MLGREAFIVGYTIQREKWKKKHNRLLQLLNILMKKRKKTLQRIVSLQMIAASLVSIAKMTRERKQRRSTLIRNGGWWDMVQREFDENRFHKTFRMSRATFWWIVSKIKFDIEKKDKGVGCIDPGERLAICLYRLTRGDYLYTIAELFGHAECTVSEIVNEVCSCIVNLLWRSTVKEKFPKDEHDYVDLMDLMNSEWQFPYAFSSVDGSHLPIKCPFGGANAMKSYFNFKGFYSIVLMGLVDARYSFLWASVGMPGNTHDSTNLQSTRLWKKIVDGSVLPEKVQKCNDVEVFPMILADGAFPFRPWLMKPYGKAILTKEEKYFNFRLSRARMSVEIAFGLLKSRFRVLCRKCETSKDTAINMALTCIVLHNICIERKDVLPRKFDLMLDLSTNKRRSRNEIRDLLDMTNQNNIITSIMGNEAEKIREAIRDKFWSEKLAAERNM